MNTYSKTGDAGETSIIGGKCLLKDDIRVASYGVIDELSSEIGLLITYCKKEHDIQFLQQVQRELFLIGRYLASDLEECSSSKALPDSHIRRTAGHSDYTKPHYALHRSNSSRSIYCLDRYQSGTSGRLRPDNVYR